MKEETVLLSGGELFQKQKQHMQWPEEQNIIPMLGNHKESSAIVAVRAERE